MKYDEIDKLCPGEFPIASGLCRSMSILNDKVMMALNVFRGIGFSLAAFEGKKTISVRGLQLNSHDRQTY